MKPLSETQGLCVSEGAGGSIEKALDRGLSRQGDRRGHHQDVDCWLHRDYLTR